MIAPLQVDLGPRSYPIYFGDDLTAALGETLTTLRVGGAKLVIVTDETVASAQAEVMETLSKTASVHVVPSGEGAKSAGHLGKIWDFLAAQKVDRGGIVVALGGGVVGDLAGFAAAGYLRGVGFVQVPTTLLAMVDSSVGGKTGINLGAGKNLVGAFHQPQAVFVATDFLRTLPAREFAAGMAEVIKYGLLGDADLFELLARDPLTVAHSDLAAVVRRCCAAKARIVEADEFEMAKTGGRALLNLGHTFAHAIEKVAGFGVYLHGEAVAIGLAAAARLSRQLGLIDQNTATKIERVIEAHDLPVRLREPMSVETLWAAMGQDKKVRAGKLRFVVIAALGRAETRNDLARDLIEGIWREVGAV